VKRRHKALVALVGGTVAALTSNCAHAPQAEISAPRAKDVVGPQGTDTPLPPPTLGPTTTEALVTTTTAEDTRPQLSTIAEPVPAPPSGAGSAPTADGVPDDAWYRAHTGSLPPAYVSACESGNDPANKRNPSSRGKWQFEWSTWRAMGGKGDPADASEPEQDYRASLLWNDGRGAGNWTCF
jgi:hypothetical protein